MRLGILLLLLAGSVCATAQTAAPVPSIPGTPAGHTLQFWLDAFNSGERPRIEAYHKKHEPDGSVDQTVGFREQTGRFDLLSIETSAPPHIAFRGQEHTGPTVAIGQLELKDYDP